jgi:uncharacterized membrane protein YkvA (DUF1232 family)
MREQLSKMAEPLEGEILPPGAPDPTERMAENEAAVRQGFWPKLRRVARRLPFAEDVVAAYYCAMDPATPKRVKAVLLAALAYFVLPADLVPDLLVGIGFTDDATVIATAIALVARHLQPRHRVQAKAALRDPDSAEA